MRSHPFLYSVRVCQRIQEYIYFRRGKCKYNKKKSNKQEQSNCYFRIITYGWLTLEFVCFINIEDGGWNKEDCNIDPVGRVSDNTVIGIKNNGDHGKPKTNSPELYTPEIRAVAKEKALYYGKNKWRPKEKLHMLPGWFVNAGKRCDPYSPARPVV